MPNGTVKLPLVGNVSKGTLVAVVGSGLAVGGYLYWKHVKNASKTAATPTAGTSYAYGYGGYGTYGYGNPPGEYYGYGTGAAGSSPFSSDYYGYGPYGYGLYGSDGQFLGADSTSGGGGGSSTTSTTPTSNAVWTQDALTELTGQGYAGETVLAALGLYLTGGTLSADQQSIVQAAIATEGYPPVEGGSGYPPGMHTAPPAGQTTGGTIAVPNVVGRTDLDTAEGIISGAGLKPASRGDSGTGNKGSVTSQSPKAGTKVASGSTVLLTYTVKGK